MSPPFGGGKGGGYKKTILERGEDFENQNRIMIVNPKISS